MLERIMSLFRRKEKEERTEEEEFDVTEDEIEELIKKAKKSEFEDEEFEDPWKDFKALCSEFGSDYREVIAKAAWMYLEETGGVEEDPLMKAKTVVDVLKELSETFDSVSEPASLKKVKAYKEGIQSVAELKKALKELKSEKITPADIFAMLKKAGLI